jgi:hypothetical protein
LFDGAGVEQDQTAGAKLLFRYCTQELPASIYSSCLLHIASWFRERPHLDLDKASEALLMACKAKPSLEVCSEAATACTLSLASYQEEDPEHVTPCLSPACEQGNKDACFRMGEVHFTARHYIEAGLAFDRAAELGHPQAAAERELVIDAMAKKRLAVVHEARDSLPKLFATCETNRRKIERFRVAGQTASSRGDLGGAQRAQARIADFEPTWLETVNTLQHAISLVAESQPGAFGQLQVKFEVACNCRRSPTGECGPPIFR